MENSVYNTSSFNALTPLVQWQEGHLACRKFRAISPQWFFFGGTRLPNKRDP